MRNHEYVNEYPPPINHTSSEIHLVKFTIRYTMASGNTGLIQPWYIFDPETDSEEEEEWILQARLQVNKNQYPKKRFEQLAYSLT